MAVRYAICPNDILLGRSHRLRPELAALPQLHEDQGITGALEHQESLVAEWMEQWLAQALPEMVPRTAWKQEHRSVRVGDVGHIVYKGTYGWDQHMHEDRGPDVRRTTYNRATGRQC